jgi:predicted ATPase
MSLFFRSMRRRRDPEDFGAFPWGIPAIRTLAELRLKTSVTFLVGENGSGKSTLLEAMAMGMRAVAVGSTELDVDPHARSHGETFLHLLKTRLVPNGLYFLDEPETPLSPTRVLALLVLIHDSVNTGSQFVIATHSPILLAFPFAQILRLDGSGIAVTSYEEVENVRIVRDFLNDPRRYMEKLFRSEYAYLRLSLRLEPARTRWCVPTGPTR